MSGPPFGLSSQRVSSSRLNSICSQCALFVLLSEISFEINAMKLYLLH